MHPFECEGVYYLWSELAEVVLRVGPPSSLEEPLEGYGKAAQEIGTKEIEILPEAEISPPVP